MNRTFVVVVVTVAVVLAGCNGVFVGGDSGASTPTVTPVAVPTDEPTPEPTPGPNTTLVPGLTGAGIENATALVAAHTSVLANSSLTKTTNTTGLVPNGSAVIRRTSTIRLGSMGEGFSAVTVRNGSYDHPNTETLPIRTEVWSRGERVITKRTYDNGTTTYDRIAADPERRFVLQSGLRFALAPFGPANTSVTKRTHNGATLYLVRGNVSDDRPGIASIRLLVDARGVIHEYRTVQIAPADTTVSRSVSTTRFSKIGATGVSERPSWVVEAMNRTTPVPNRTIRSPTGTTIAVTTDRNTTTRR